VNAQYWTRAEREAFRHNCADRLRAGNFYIEGAEGNRILATVDALETALRDAHGGKSGVCGHEHCHLGLATDHALLAALEGKP
jgi:hypothetical protein